MIKAIENQGIIKQEFEADAVAKHHSLYKGLSTEYKGMNYYEIDKDMYDALYYIVEGLGATQYLFRDIKKMPLAKLEDSLSKYLPKNKARYILAKLNTSTRIILANCRDTGIMGKKDDDTYYIYLNTQGLVEMMLLFLVSLMTPAQFAELVPLPQSNYVGVDNTYVRNEEWFMDKPAMNHIGYNRALDMEQRVKIITVLWNLIIN